LLSASFPSKTAATHWRSRCFTGTFESIFEVWRVIEDSSDFFMSADRYVAYTRTLESSRGWVINTLKCSCLAAFSAWDAAKRFQFFKMTPKCKIGLNWGR
jgi:hypothetical protein